MPKRFRLSVGERQEHLRAFLDSRRFRRFLDCAPFDFLNGVADPVGRNGRRLCRWCGGSLKRPKQVTWCSQACVDEFMIRKSGSLVRRLVFERDRGQCGFCGLDCVAMIGEAKALRERLHRIDRACVSSNPCQGCQSLLAFRWEAAHIVAVVDGGGCCGLDNYKTACWNCHQKADATIRRRTRKRPI